MLAEHAAQLGLECFGVRFGERLLCVPAVWKFSVGPFSEKIRAQIFTIVVAERRRLSKQTSPVVGEDIAVWHSPAQRTKRLESVAIADDEARIYPLPHGPSEQLHGAGIFVHPSDQRAGGGRRSTIARHVANAAALVRSCHCIVGQ